MNTTFDRFAPPVPELMQWAAVISTLPAVLSTTLAVQKWSPLLSLSNRAPTRGTRASCRGVGVLPGEGRVKCRLRNAPAPSSRCLVQYPEPPGAAAFGVVPADEQPATGASTSSAATARNRRFTG